MISLNFEQMEAFQIQYFSAIDNVDEIVAKLAEIAPESGGDVEVNNGAIIDLALVVSEFHIRVAAARACTNRANEKMKTKSLMSEIMYQMAGTTKISEALLQFQVKPTTQSLAIIRSTSSEAPSPDHLSSLAQLVRGTESDIALLCCSETLNTDKINHIVKVFKISKLELEATTSVEDIVVSRIAMKDLL